MPEESKDETHHVAGGVSPLIKRQKPSPQRPKPRDPTDQELFRVHQLAEAAMVESPEELAERLSRLHEGLRGLDEDEDELPPAG